MIGTASTQSVTSQLHNKVVSFIGDSIQSDLISLFKEWRKGIILFWSKKVEFYFGRILGTEFITISSHCYLSCHRPSQAGGNQ